MSTEKRSCQGTTDEGDPCGAPEGLVDPETGFCPAHGPGGRSEMSRRGTRGAYASHKGGLKDQELPKLEDHEDAKRWLELIGRAVATKRLSDRRAQAAIRAVEAWMKAEAEQLGAEAIEGLQERLSELEDEVAGANLRRVS